VQSSSSSSNGNFVVIEHNGTYSTKYLHMQKRAVASGQRVKQGQIIGYVGSTGYATGPHLHYEFLVNGVHTNPATIASKLPKADRIAVGEQRRFSEQVRNLQTQFAAHGQQNNMAASEEIREPADTSRKTL
jgi:murein DD-endopeptidase MepM/ murein hydrolase activator NlpD